MDGGLFIAYIIPGTNPHFFLTSHTTTSGKLLILGIPCELPRPADKIIVPFPHSNIP